MPAPIADPGAWGTQRVPLIQSRMGWDYLHPFLQDRMEHVHLMSGECVRNVFGPPCVLHEASGPDWGQECSDPSCHRPAVLTNNVNEWVCGVHE